MKPLLKALQGGVEVHVPSDAYISLTNSPYPAHILASATDIYAEYPYMPCEKGRVVKVLEFPTPKHREDAEGRDYLILIDVGSAYLKVLHVRPSVKVGDEVRLGDYLGEYVLSGYLMRWSDRHMHVEVRRRDDPVRALGAVGLAPTEELLGTLERLRCCRGLVLKIAEFRGTYYLCEPLNCDVLCTEVGEGVRAVLDAGLPHYGVGGAVILSSGDCKVPKHAEVRICGEVIGECLGVKPQLRKLLVRSTRAFAVGKQMFGVGTYLLRRYVKLVPLSTGNHGLRVGDVIKLGTVDVEVKLPRWFKRLLR